MTKEVLRSTYKQKRSSLTERDRSRLNDLLLIQFQRVPVPYDTGVLLNYWPLEQQSEVNTFLMADYLQFRLPGLQIAYPVINADNLTMQAMLTDEHTIFQPNRYGIAEPVNGNFIPAVSIDLIFVPLLAFDLRGYRVGYGKGFYDRFLACCRKDSIKIGFSYFEPVGAIDGIDRFDVPLTTGITPGDTYEF